MWVLRMSRVFILKKQKHTLHSEVIEIVYYRIDMFLLSVALDQSENFLIATTRYRVGIWEEQMSYHRQIIVASDVSKYGIGFAMNSETVQ